MTTEPTTPDLTDEEILELEQLLVEDDKLAETIDHAEQRRKAIRAILAKKLPDGTRALGGRKVIISVPARLDAAALGRDYPVTAYPHLYEPKLSTSAVRDNIAAVDLAKYAKAGQRQVTVK
ncbi:hypothetical protein ACFS27_03260 [Promicromonospora vindobonensis]|uniref:Uncharacterized protein n=1 Tax=Promicromonospora vindobonensis TaxID=195748 RepID=A0ABW5VMX9_9MICO